MFVYNYNNGRSGGGIGCLIFGILGMIAAYYILKGLFTLLAWAAPVLFVLALIINWKAVASTGKDFLALLERNPVMGLLTGALAVIGFPLLALYLFLKAIGYSKIATFNPGGFNQPEQPAEHLEEFTDFEELESTPKNQEPLHTEMPVAPPEMPEKSPEPPKADNPYEKLFPQ